MLTISKPTLFGPDGLAARGQCNPDSPGWQLRWFTGDSPAVPVWQGAYKTCRHLHMSCAGVETLDEVNRMVEELLNANSFAKFASQPTDAYPTPARTEKGAGEAHPGGGKKRKKKKQ
jgi:hypothetical protein